MTPAEFKALEVGDIVYHVSDRNNTYVVMANWGDYVAVVRCENLTNPAEWKLASKVVARVAPYVQPPEFEDSDHE